MLINKNYIYSIILLSIILFLYYLNLDAPIYLIKKKNNKITCCIECNK